MDANGTQAVQDAIRAGMEEIAGAYAPAQHERVAARLTAALHDEPDPFDGGCPADVCSNPCHGGRGGTMGDAAAAMPPRPFTAEENRVASNMAAASLLNDLRRKIASGDLRDLREIGNRIELATLLIK
jgi:hypothetical protein